jgi:hypothetical protein
MTGLAARLRVMNISRFMHHKEKKIGVISQIASIAILELGLQFSFPFVFPVETAEGPLV